MAWKPFLPLEPQALRGGSRLVLCVALLVGGVLLLAVAGCGFDPTVHVSMGWFDAPADDSQVPIGVPVRVMVTFRVYSRIPTQATLAVSGPQDASLPMVWRSAGESLYAAEVIWTPPQEGTYHLKAYLCDRDGDCLDTDTLTLEVLGVQAHLGRLPPSATASATVPAPSPTASPQPTPTPFPPTATFTALPPTATWTAPPPPTWTASPRPPTRTPSPTPDTVDPVVERVSTSVEQIKWPECEPSAVTFTARVTDAGGVSEVRLLFRVHRGDATGVWVNKLMSRQGNTDVYTVTLTADELPQSLDPPANASAASWLEYYVVGLDRAGNSGQAPSGGVGYRLTVTLCTVVR